MKVEIWSDVVCPWCYIGKRRLETALAGFAHRDEIEIVWHSFELDAGAPRRAEGDPAGRLAAKYGMSLDAALAAQRNLTEVAAGEGLDFHLDVARSGNSLDAHRLVHLAADTGLAGEMKERLFAAYLEEGRAIGDPATLRDLAVEVGLDPLRVDDVLAGDEYTADVRADEEEAMELGVSGVPFFVVDRTFGVSGAQPAEVLAAALDRAWDKAHPLQMVTTPGGGDASCDGGSCSV